MDAQTALLLFSIACLCMAIILRWGESINKACERNVTDNEREMLRRARNECEHLIGQLERAVKAAERGMQPLAVKTPKQTDRKPKKAARERR